jgi:hypothetical protein
MKLTIPTILMALTLMTAGGCGSSAKMETITPADGSMFPSTGSKYSPEATGTDEVVAPKSDTPPALPTPPKAPETPTPPSGGTPSGGGSPVTIEHKGDLAPVAFVPPSDPGIILLMAPEVKTSVVLSERETISCKDCADGTGDSKIFVCPDNYVVTGFEAAWADTSDCSDHSSTAGCGDYTTFALKIKCSPMTDLNISPESTEFATVFPTAETVAGDASAAINIMDDPTKPMTRKASCPIYSGAANGVSGWVDGKLITFGFDCANYYRSGPAVDFLSSSNKTSAIPDIEFGSEFNQKCPENEALVGLQIRSDGSKVLGIDNLYCSGPSLLTYSPITVGK